MQAIQSYFLKHKSNYHFLFPIMLGIGKLFLGILYSSYWFMITACYYIVLGVTRCNLLHHEQSGKQDVGVMIHVTGGFLVLIGSIYLALCLWMMQYQITIQYPYYILYGVVAIAFYKIMIAIYGFIKARKQTFPIDGLITTLALLDACVSMVAVQCALLSMEQSTYASTSSAYLGIAVSIIFLICGLYYLKK